MKLSLLLVIIILGFTSCNPDSKSSKLRRQDTLTATIPIDKQAAVLFVQWQYPNSIDGMKALDFRNKIETLVDKSLRNSGQGRWIAGDLGPGGANMLFEVNDAKKALSLVFDILKDQSIEKESIIAIDNGSAERGATPSNFKVIYPKNYNGTFNDL